MLSSLHLPELDMSLQQRNGKRENLYYVNIIIKNERFREHKAKKKQSACSRVEIKEVEL